MALNILHIAPANIAGVPITLVNAERKLGHRSRLITFFRDARNYPEDICLNLPFLDFWGTRFVKKWVSHPGRLAVHHEYRVPKDIPPVWQPNGLPERFFMQFREWVWRPRLKRLCREIDFWHYDVYQLDGGLEFFRDGRTIRKLKALGKKVICCYTGSDLRTRGVIPSIDALSDLNVSTEFDHIQLHPNIHHVRFPFDLSKFSLSEPPENGEIRIGHAPTSRQAKGSGRIISTIRELREQHPVKLILIENLPHDQAIKLKSQCHIFVDQIGNLGYGINSLEALAMGIPTCSCLAPGFEKVYPDHPFVVIDEHNIKDALLSLVQNAGLRERRRKSGREWVKKYHDHLGVVRAIHNLAGLPDVKDRTTLVK